MNAPELLDRISRWEDLHTEFKQALDSREELAKDLVCLANTDGGQLIFGVSEDRAIVGVADIDALLRAVEDVAYNRCEPPLSVVQETVEHDGARVLVVNVPKGDERPYRTRSGRFYIRTAASGCRQASRSELLRLFQATDSLYYDELPLTRLSLPTLTSMRSSVTSTRPASPSSLRKCRRCCATGA
jgi:ATP-dependent DNA helicase RecG